jgi:hypothetical protein
MGGVMREGRPGGSGTSNSGRYWDTVRTIAPRPTTVNAAFAGGYAHAV